MALTPPVPGGDPEEVQVYDTDYTTFALVLSRRQSGDQGILRIYLLCEPLALQPWWRRGVKEGGTSGQGPPATHYPP